VGRRKVELNKEYFIHGASQIVSLACQVCYSNTPLNVERLQRGCWMLECESSIYGIIRETFRRI